MSVRQIAVGVYCSGREKNKLDEEAISEILVADSDPESGSEASDFEEYFEEEDEEVQQQQQQQKSKHRLQQVVDYRHGDHLKEGTQIFILLSVQQKV